MKVKFEHDRLEMLPENKDEEIFATDLQRLINAVSNEFMAWYGDVKFEKETSGFVITWKPERNPKKAGIEARPIQ